MTSPAEITYVAADAIKAEQAEGGLIVFVGADGALGAGAAAVDAAAGGAIRRLLGSKGWKAEVGAAAVLDFPSGLAAERLIVAPRGDSASDARRAGAAAAAKLGKGGATVLGDASAEIE
ncbi:MAG: M17 family peptidase N-terminal domain-containing protein, partial [Rubrimonas sp.]